MRYWLLLTTIVPLVTDREEGKSVHKQRSKIKANDLAHALVMKKELCSDYVDRDNPPSVWMEGVVCAEVYTGRQSGLWFIPVDCLSSLARDIGMAAEEYSNEKNKMGSKLKPSVFVRPAAEPARLSDILPTPSTKYNDDEE